MGDPGGYRAALEDEEWQAKDPIRRLVRAASFEGFFDEAAAEGAARTARAEVEAAVAFAADSPFPDPALPAELTYAS